MTEERIITRLKITQAEYALDALLKANQGSQKDLLRHAGVVQGYQKAIDDINTLLNEEQENDRERDEP